MWGISSSGKEAIAFAIEKMFDALAYKFLGNIPKVRNKSPYFNATPKFSLANLFLQAMNNKELNHYDKDVLRSTLNTSYGYIEGLKNKTSSNVINAVDSLIRESKANNAYVGAQEVSEIISSAMKKAQSDIKLIAEAESTKTRNLGHTMEIVDRSKQEGIEDPNVFFVIVRDGETCKECLRLHMLDDLVTPRVWKMSELSMGYHKRGEPRPSACGEHPFCRCSLQQLPPGWGFKGGFVHFISLEHNEYTRQRDLS
jgi:hypothetical protein